MKRLGLLIFLHILLLYKITYIAWPENLLWPYLNLHGLSFYTNIFYIYPPLYVALLSLFDRFFGISLFSLQTLSYFTVIVTDFLLWRISNKRYWPLFIYVPLQIFFEGNGLWPDQLLAPIFLAAYWSFQKKKYFLLGVLLGLALLTKQTAAYFALGIFLMSRPVKVIPGLVLTLLLGVVYLVFNNSFRAFFDETLRYILTYHAGNSLQVLLPNKSQLIAVGLVFLPAIIIGRKSRRQLLALTLLSALGVFTRFEYFHLQPALPFAALLLSQGFVALPFLAIFTFLFLRFYVSNFGLSPRFLTADILTNAQTVNTVIPPGSRTFFFNTWDHYYYLTDTLPAGDFFVSQTPWNWSYPGIEEKFIRIMEDEKPQYVVLGNCFQINNRCYRPEKIAAYIEANFREALKLSDGTGVFEYNPVRPGQELQSVNCQP